MTSLQLPHGEEAGVIDDLPWWIMACNKVNNIFGYLQPAAYAARAAISLSLIAEPADSKV